MTVVIESLMCCQSQVIWSESRVTLWSKSWNSCWRRKLQHADTSYPQQRAAYNVQVPLPCDRYDTHIYICSHADKIESLQVNITTQMVQLRKPSAKTVIWKALVWSLVLNFLLTKKKWNRKQTEDCKIFINISQISKLKNQML